MDDVAFVGISAIIGIIFLGSFCLFIIISEVQNSQNLADGLCKLKFGDDYEFKEFEWDGGTQEVICEKISEHDFDSVVIREG